MTQDFQKTFFSQKRAEDFARILKKNKAQDIEISSARDAFGQTQYRVRWN